VTREHIRHDAGKRNRKKNLRLARRLRCELEFQWARHQRQQVRFAYMLDRINKLVNRLKSEK
jgi:IS5 family transposase